MKIVIQCAGGKRYDDAGSLELSNGNPLLFVARPEKAPPDGKHSYARPDDISDDRRTWRQRLLDYNRNNARTNPNGILPAYKLYRNAAYEDLVNKFGIDRVFILSAGWGLIPADFLTAIYNITFSASGQPYSRRKRGDKYQDFNMLPDDGDNVVFLGGRDYLRMFFRLTAGHTGGKTVFFNSKEPPDVPSDDFDPRLYETNRRTNWQYECANALIDGKIEV